MAVFMVIGLSNFGSVLAQTLYNLGEEVIVVDECKDRVQQMKDLATEAIIANATDKKILENLVKDTITTAIICLGDNLEQSIMICYHLKQLGVKHIIAKSRNEDMDKVLSLLGADEIINPEKDMALRLAEKLHNPKLLEIMQLGQDYVIMEVAVPQLFIGKSLEQLDVNKKYHVNILAIKHSVSGEFVTVPRPDYIFADSDLLLVLGKQNFLANLTQM